MDDNQQADQRKQKDQSVPASIGELQRIATAIEAHTKAAEQQPQHGGDPTKPLFVQQVGGDDLEPFEEQTLAISRQALDISRQTYRIAVLAFLAALAAAIFIWSQVKIMSYQTQIMASQSEGANAGALMDEMNTRKQLAIAQQQAQSAQQAVAEINRQTRSLERAWIGISIPMEKTIETVAENQPIKSSPIEISVSGNTVARKIHADAVIEFVKNGKSPTFDYSWDHDQFTTGILGKNEVIRFNAFRYVRQHSRRIAVLLPLSQTEFQEYTRGEAYIAVYARVKYWDTFGIKHWVRRCAWVHQEPPAGVMWGWTAYKCANYGDTDNN